MAWKTSHWRRFFLIILSGKIALMSSKSASYLQETWRQVLRVYMLDTKWPPGWILEPFLMPFTWITPSVIVVFRLTHVHKAYLEHLYHHDMFAGLFVLTWWNNGRMGMMKYKRKRIDWENQQHITEKPKVSLFLHPKIRAYKCIMNICLWAERLVNYFWCLHKENVAGRSPLTLSITKNTLYRDGYRVIFLYGMKIKSQSVLCHWFKRNLGNQYAYLQTHKCCRIL